MIRHYDSPHQTLQSRPELMKRDCRCSETLKKITWYPLSSWLMRNDPAWLKHTLVHKTLIVLLSMLPLITLTVSFIANSPDLLSPWLCRKKELNYNVGGDIFFFFHCVLMVDIRGTLAFSWDEKRAHSVSKPAGNINQFALSPPKITLMLFTYSYRTVLSLNVAACHHGSLERTDTESCCCAPDWYLLKLWVWKM